MKKLTKPARAKKKQSRLAGSGSDAEWLCGIPSVRTRNALIRAVLRLIPGGAFDRTEQLWGQNALTALRLIQEESRGVFLAEAEDIGTISLEQLRPWAKRHKIYMCPK